MIKFLKRKFVILMFIAVAVWLIYTCMHFWDYAMAWAAGKVDVQILLSQIIFLILKNIPTFTSFFIAKKFWYDE